MGERAKLDMNHGFVKSIVRNQKDRDNYDKEMKLEKAQQKYYNSRRNGLKTRKPDAEVYVPPHRTTRNANGLNMRKAIFLLQFEAEDKKIHEMMIYEDSNLDEEAKDFAKKAGICEPLIPVLREKLQEKTELFVEKNKK